MKKKATKLSASEKKKAILNELKAECDRTRTAKVRACEIHERAEDAYDDACYDYRHTRKA